MTHMLEGFTVGITADRRSDEQAAHFERRGASVVHGPTIRTVPLIDGDELRTATAAVLDDPPDVVLATTAIGMRSWIGAADAWGVGDRLVATLADATVVARGPKAAAVLHGYGVRVQGRPASERYSDCVDLVRDAIGPGTRVVVQRDGGPPPRVSHELRALGAVVTEVPVYRCELASDPRPALRLASAVIAGRIHAVTFTTGPAIDNWFDIVSDHGLRDSLRAHLAGGDVVVGCIGPVCADAAVSAGLGDGDLVVAPVSRLGSLIASVTDRLSSKALWAGRMKITGTVVHTGTATVELSDIEARILAVLAARPGVVVGKSDMLAQVWHDPGGDPHLVEVAVGRLRRRLGDDGYVVVAVPRRGYVLDMEVAEHT